MTTIAYSAKHKILCSDSRASNDDDTHFSTFKKIYRLPNRALYANSGESDDRDLRALLSKATPRKMPTRAQIIALKQPLSCVIIFPKGQCYCVELKYDDEIKDWLASVDLVSDPYIAVGSGAHFALGALEVGATPQDAVRAACRRDTASALPLQWEKL